MILNLTELSNNPLHEQISVQLLRSILSGDYEPGHELLPARALASRQHVSVSSVARAYDALEQEGVIRRVANHQYVVVPMNEESREEIRHRRLRGAVDPNEWRRLETEMATARQIQAGLLPKCLPDDAWLTIAAYTEPSLTVGGDFHDVISLDADRVAVVIADASGKGLPAAMMISQIHGMLHSEVNHGNSIRTTLRNVNDQLAEFSDKEKFLTLFYGVFERSTGVFEFANAGHNHPILMREDGSSEPLVAGGMVLGIAPGADFATGKVTLGTGDMVFLYTDGVTETRDALDEEYGEARLLDILRRNRYQPADAVIDAVLTDLCSFHAAKSLQDDRTLLVLKAKDVAARVF